MFNQLNVFNQLNAASLKTKIWICVIINKDKYFWKKDKIKVLQFYL